LKQSENQLIKKKDDNILFKEYQLGFLF